MAPFLYKAVIGARVVVHRASAVPQILYQIHQVPYVQMYFPLVAFMTEYLHTYSIQQECTAAVQASQRA